MSAPDMRIVEQVLYAPGCCPLTGVSEGPFLETEQMIQYGSGTRFTPSVAYVRRLGEAVGMIPGEEVAQVVSSIEDELEQLRAWKAAAEEDLADYVALRGAVAQVLRGGLSVDKKGIVQPKPWPGVAVPRELDEQTALERLSEAHAGSPLDAGS